MPGCPPTPQALIHGFITLHKKIETQSLRTVPWYRAGEDPGVPIPILGPDIIDPRQAELIRRQAERAAQPTEAAAPAAQEA